MPAMTEFRRRRAVEAGCRSVECAGQDPWHGFGCALVFAPASNGDQPPGNDWRRHVKRGGSGPQCRPRSSSSLPTTCTGRSRLAPAGFPQRVGTGPHAQRPAIRRTPCYGCPNAQRAVIRRLESCKRAKSSFMRPPALYCPPGAFHSTHSRPYPPLGDAPSGHSEWISILGTPVDSSTKAPNGFILLFHRLTWELTCQASQSDCQPESTLAGNAQRMANPPSRLQELPIGPATRICR